MKLNMRSIVFLFLVSFSFNAFSSGFFDAINGKIDLSKSFSGFVEIKTDSSVKKLYSEYYFTGLKNPTVILLNGLTYSTAQWKQLKDELLKRNFNILLYDMDGMGFSLFGNGLQMHPYQALSQAHDLFELLRTLEIPKPYNLVGLSYGGGIAALFAAEYPHLVRKNILLAPYTGPLADQDLWIKKQIAQTRILYPYSPFTDDDLYDYFLKQIVYSTYPSVEPIVLEHPWKLEAVFRLTQGIRKSRISESVGRWPDSATSLIIADKDQYIPRQVLLDFWQNIPATKKDQFFIVENSEHKIPEAQPLAAAKLIEQILN